jgi:hypothetical protein
VAELAGHEPYGLADRHLLRAIAAAALHGGFGQPKEGAEQPKPSESDRLSRINILIQARPECLQGSRADGNV